MRYYTLQVATGREQEFVDNARRKLSEELQPNRFIHITRKLHIRRGGRRMEDVQPMFPSYVFIEQEGPVTPGQVYAFKRLKGFYQFLKSNRDVRPLIPKDVELLRKFAGQGGGSGQLGASLVSFDENDRIVVHDGPMMGLEGFITKVDRRKQRAKIVIEFNESSFTLDLAFDLLEKRPEEKETGEP